MQVSCPVVGDAHFVHENDGMNVYNRAVHGGAAALGGDDLCAARLPLLRRVQARGGGEHARTGWLQQHMACGGFFMPRQNAPSDDVLGRSGVPTPHNTTQHIHKRRPRRSPVRCGRRSRREGRGSSRRSGGRRRSSAGWSGSARRESWGVGCVFLC